MPQAPSRYVRNTGRLCGAINSTTSSGPMSVRLIRSITRLNVSSPYLIFYSSRRQLKLQRDRLSGQDSRVEGVMVNDDSMRGARLVNREQLYVRRSRRRVMFESIPTTQRRSAAL
jgi:hypothetical protein